VTVLAYLKYIVRFLARQLPRSTSRYASQEPLI
jgi:hypothetical protein